MSHTTWWQYVEISLARLGWSAAEFERKTGIDRSRINFWRDKDVLPTADLARKTAEAFGDPVVTAYLAAGILRRDDLEQPVELPADLASVHTDVLFAELRRRVRDFGNGVDIPTDDDIAAHPERYSEGRLTLDRESEARRGAPGASSSG